MIYGVEWGTAWESEDQTDFENPTLVTEDRRGALPAVCLSRLTVPSVAWCEPRKHFRKSASISFDPKRSETKLISYSYTLGPRRRRLLLSCTILIISGRTQQKSQQVLPVRSSSSTHCPFSLA